jgi:uncharacterized membrane protein
VTEREKQAQAVGAIGRWFFALALLGLGAEHFVFREFVVGRAPAWPGVVPGRLLFVYLTGAVVMLTGVAIMGRRWGRAAALGLGVLVFVWAFLRHLPLVAADSVLAGSWTRAGKALTMFGGSFAVAATLPPIPGPMATGWRRFANVTNPFIRLGQISLASFLIIAGLQHFKFTKLVTTLFPAWFPGNTIWWSQFAGALLIAGGVGLLFRRTAAIAGLLAGLMIFSWFWIVHLPRVRTSVSDGIALFEALAFSGIALVVSGAAYSTRFQTSQSLHRASPSPIARLEAER